MTKLHSKVEITVIRARKGQRSFFEVRLPKTAKNIIAIETTTNATGNDG